MNPVTCPLAAKQPLADLTAESARNAVKTFEGLDYSPHEVRIAAHVEKTIREHAQLGFTQCILTEDFTPSDKMVRYLQSEPRGFQVERYRKAHIRNFYPETTYTPAAYSMWKEELTYISWGDPIKAPDGFVPFSEWSDEKAEAELRATKKKALEEFEERRALKEAEETQRHAKLRHTSHGSSSGCLPLLLALPTALYFLIS